MLNHMGLMVADWQEDSFADLGQTLIDTLAYAADYASYYQDAVATEAYLGTARLRRSVRRHVRLLDYTLHEGCNSRVWVQVAVKHTAVSQKTGIWLEKGTQFWTKIPDFSDVVIEQGSQTHLNLFRKHAAHVHAPRVFETMHATRLFPALNKISFLHAGGRDPYLPKGATTAKLHFPKDGGLRPPLRRGHVLILIEKEDPTDPANKRRDASHRHAVRLIDCQWRDDENRWVAEITWAAEDALPFPLYIKPYQGRAVSFALGNIVLADYGRSINGDTAYGEKLDRVPERGRFLPQLRFTNLTHSTAYDHISAQTESATLMLCQNPREALPIVALIEHRGPLAINQKNHSLLPVTTTPADAHRNQPPQQQSTALLHWRLRRDLLSSSRFARDFVTEMEGDGRAYLRFGYAGHGRDPKPGTQFIAQYRVGNGPDGNVGSDTLTHIILPPTKSESSLIEAINNPLAAQGGQVRERLEKARLEAPYAFRHSERCVTAEDYATQVKRHTDVRQAVAQLHWTGSWYTVFVYVQRQTTTKVEPAFRQELIEFLEKFRLMGYDVQIRGPRYVPLAIKLNIVVAAGHHARTVEQALTETFSAKRLSGGKLGFFHPSCFTFGQPVYRSEVVAHAMAVPGVARVDVDTFRRSGSANIPENNLIAVISPTAVLDMQALEIAQLDYSPVEQQQTGSLHFHMEGGL